MCVCYSRADAHDGGPGQASPSWVTLSPASGVVPVVKEGCLGMWVSPHGSREPYFPVCGEDFCVLTS